MVWDYIPKEEARSMEGVWAIEDARKRRQKEATTRRERRSSPQPDDPSPEVQPLEGSTAWPPQAMVDELKLVVGEFGLEKPIYRASDYAPKGEHIWGTWGVLHPQIYRSHWHATGRIVQGSDGVHNPMNTWSIYVNVDIKGARSFRTNLRWAGGKLFGKVRSPRIGILNFARGECTQCHRRTVVDGPHDSCIPCCQRQLASGKIP